MTALTRIHACAVLLAWLMLAGCNRSAGVDVPQPEPPPEPIAAAEDPPPPAGKLQLIRPDDRKTVKALRQQGATLVRNAQGNVVTVELRDGATDDDLALVAQLRCLRSVDITGAKATAFGVAQLADVPGLETLVANRTQLNDEVLAKLSHTKLKELSAANAPISDRGLDLLSTQTELQRLDLSWTHVTAAGVSALQPLKQLERLNLSFTEVDDSALEHLAALQGLKTLTLEGADMSAVALEKLQQSLPQTRILHSALVPAVGQQKKSDDQDKTKDKHRIET